MRHRLLILKKEAKACMKKRKTIVTNMIGTVVVTVCLLSCHIGNIGTVQIYAEITTVSETGDIWNVTDVKPKVQETEGEQPTERELAEDTLGGIPSVGDTSAGMLQLFSQNMPVVSTGDAVLGEPAVTAFHAQEQNKDIEVAQQNETEGKTKEVVSGEAVTANVTVKRTTQKAKEQSAATKIMLSQKDKTVLLRIVEAEAGTEDLKGKMLVANVVLNRVNCKTEFPDSVTDVVFDHTGGVYQFSPIGDGRYWSVTISNETKEAVKRVLNGEDPSKGALYFMARKYAAAHNVNWFDQNLTRLYEHGGHEFFR